MVTSLLEVYLLANPTRGKADEEKREIAKSYKPGDLVMPQLSRRRHKEEDDAEDRRLLEEVRELSLQASRGPRPGDGERARARTARPVPRNRSYEARGLGSPHRRTEEEGQSRRAARDRLPASDRDGNRDQHQRPDAHSRLIEHQSSLRSLLSASDIDSSDIEDEIARRIIEDGILDDIDLSALDVSQEEEISERIAEAYRRHHLERTGEREASQRGITTGPLPGAERGREMGGRTRSRSHSASVQARDTHHGRSRAAVGTAAVPDGRRRRRSDHTRSSAASAIRNSSQGRGSDAVPAAMRSATDLTDRPRSSRVAEARPVDLSTTGRRTTDPDSGRTNRHLQPDDRTRTALPQADTASTRQYRPDRYGDPSSTSVTSPSIIRARDTEQTAQIQGSYVPTDKQRHEIPPGLGLQISPPNQQPASMTPTGRSRSIVYPEPSISCQRCQKPHLEYELHYNCSKCDKGDFDICLACYRQGRGCKHWYGFGYAAWTKYERLAPAGGYPPNQSLPHTLTGHRYLRPTQNLVQSAPNDNSRRLLTTEDPLKRLQTGVFCSICASFSNTCFWKCDLCNEGEWGFCNACVNTGRCCTHPLLPLVHLPPKDMGNHEVGATATATPHIPPGATLLCGPWIVDQGPLKPLSISTTCNICHLPIQPSSTRFHCPQCNGGNYDICASCYVKLSGNGKISPENGSRGWRRCLRGHRMMVVGFEDRDGGRRRIVVRDLVGGLALKEETSENAAGSNMGPADLGDNWSWRDGPDGRRASKLVSKGVAAASSTTSEVNESPAPFLRYPPDGGIGMRVLAQWSYHPAEGVADELMFPRGAEIREVEDINQDWYWGCYAGSKGLFPGTYVRVLDVVRM